MVGGSFQEIVPRDRMKVPVRVYASQHLAPSTQIIAALKKIASLTVLAAEIFAMAVNIMTNPTAITPAAIMTSINVMPSSSRRPRRHTAIGVSCFIGIPQ